MITELVIAHLQQVLRDLEAESQRHERRLGAAPSSLVAEQRVASLHESFNTGPVLQRWLVERTSATPLSLDESLSSPTRVGMYYDVGRADFSIDEKAGTVRIGWQVGPRYGRGYVCAIELAPDGVVTLGKPKSLWVS